MWRCSRMRCTWTGMPATNGRSACAMRARPAMIRPRRCAASKGRSKEAAKGQVVLVGNFACDFAPVKAGLVDCLCAPPGSALANPTSAGIEHRAFDGWNRLTKELLK